MRGAFCSITVFLLIVSAPVKAAIRIDSSLIEVLIGRNVEYIEDAGGSLTFDQVKNSRGMRWTRSDMINPGFGFTRSAFWLRFTLENPAARDIPLYLEEAYPLIDEIDFYLPDGVSGYRYISAGDYLPFASRPFEYRTFVFPFTQKAGSSSTYYMRVHTTSSMSLPLTLWEPDAFRHRILREDRIMMLFYGMIMLMIIYNLLMYAAIRHRSYLYYVLFIAFFMFFIMTQQGTAFQFFWPQYPRFANACIPIILALMIVFAFYYTRSFLPRGMDFIDTRVVYQTFIVIPWFAVAISLLALSYDMYPAAMAGTTMLAFLAIVGAVYIAVRLSLKRIRAAYFYLSGWLVFFMGSSLYIGKTFNMLPSNFVTNWSILIGALFMLVVLSIAQADLMNRMRKDLAVLSSGLEVKVRERTEELEQAMKELGTVNSRLHDMNERLETAQMVADLDINMASNLQMSLLPRHLKEFDNWDLACAYLPMKGVSGDFYDVYHDGSILRGIALFDVSGHGIASGLLTIVAKSILYRHFTQMAERRLSTIMKHFNDDLIAEIKEVDNYLTGILLRITDSALEFVNACHIDLLMRDGDTGSVKQEKPAGHVSRTCLLGIDGIESRFDVLRFTMNEGDTLLLFSDGIIECRNGKRVAFGEERLAQVFREAPNGSAQATIDYILEKATAYIGGVPFHDDVTVIALMRTGRKKRDRTQLLP